VIELLRRPIGDRDVTVVCTERSDGDVHPLRVSPSDLRDRQLAATGRTWAMLDQVHGTGRVDHDSCGPTGGDPVIGVGDVLVAVGGRPVAIWAADCAPVVLVDDDGAIVGCHAGWRGLAAGVIDVAAAAGRVPRRAVLGPCIHPCCYEFGSAELERVAEGLGVAPSRITATTTSGSPALDVPTAVGLALGNHGIELDVVGPCTGCDRRWFSHRRGDVGRHAVVAWSEPAR
jgi:copper oxidase (laccase) domain-containing protein